MQRDVLLGENLDLQIKSGDFVISDSDAQNVRLIVDLHKGNVKQYPLTGFGVSRLLNGAFDGVERRQLQMQLEADGYRMRQVAYDGVNLKIEF